MRHMMPKEILDAVDLQPQYRTFSEILDSLLQQARQRADVYVGDVCHSTRKVGTVTPRVSANMNDPPATKTTTPVPTNISQLSSNVSKTETENRRVHRTNTSKSRNAMETKRFAVKGKGKGGFKRTCFKCGMRGQSRSMLAERKRKRKQGRLGERKKWIQTKRMVPRKTVKPWSHVGQLLVHFTLARKNVRSRSGSVVGC